MDSTVQLLQRAAGSLIGNYARQPIVMARGEGSLVWDSDGRRYIDLFAGFGGCVLGHCHPALREAAAQQASHLWHVGNTYHSLPQIELAERLNRTAFPGRAFYCHSGLEANEAAVKLARLRGSTMSPRRWKVVALHRSFHGRSLAMIAATGNPKIREGFDPIVPGFSHVELGDLEGLTAAVDDETCAVIIEPIQGEGGIHPVDAAYAAELRRLCDARQITLIFDEVWTGCGRTGRWFGHQHFARADGSVVVPDIMTLGKAIGGGLPVGVMFARADLAALMVPGKHGCTLGGNPICMAVARTIFDVIDRERLLEHAERLGAAAMQRLRGEARLRARDVRGRGLFLGIEMAQEDPKLLERALARGLILNVTAGKVVRLAPPVNIDAALWNEGLDILVDLLGAA